MKKPDRREMSPFRQFLAGASLSFLFMLIQFLYFHLISYTGYMLHILSVTVRGAGKQLQPVRHIHLRSYCSQLFTQTVTQLLQSVIHLDSYTTVRLIQFSPAGCEPFHVLLITIKLVQSLQYKYKQTLVIIVMCNSWSVM